MNNELLINNLKSNNSEFKSNNEKKQIDLISKIIARKSKDYRNPNVAFMTTAKKSATAIYHQFCKMQSEAKQIEGWWEWYEEWSPSTTEHPRECDECGWRCHECETPLADVVGGYWDDPEEVPNLKFCPECGAKMKGGAE